MNLAPIVLFVYNRPWHTQQTLNALELNVLADKSTLYIYCDGAKIEASEKDLENIKKVRDFVKTKQWCKKVEIIERDTNLGLANSVIKGVTEVVEKHGKVIVLEDDIVTGNYFLSFMNESLEVYKNDETVFGVSGYKYPSIEEIKPSTYFLPISCSWSFATWSNRWSKVNFDGKQLLNEINKKGLENALNFGNYPFYEMLKNQIDGLNDSWAIRFYVSMFLNKSLFLYPNHSLVENIGFDNSGTHSTDDAFFIKNIESQNKIKILKENPFLNQDIVKLVQQSFVLENSSKKKPVKKNREFVFLIKKRIKSFFNIDKSK